MKYTNCLKLSLYEANINQSDILNFENIFVSKECAKKCSRRQNYKNI